jgi:hypothetical protein
MKKKKNIWFILNHINETNNYFLAVNFLFFLEKKKEAD